MAIYILTDSTADLRPDEAARKGIWIVPLKVMFGEEAFQDELDHAGFFRRLAQAEDLPTTSQANPDDFLPYFQRAKGGGDSVICLPMASSLSGTCQSALIARELCGYEGVYVVDSTQTVLGLRLLIDLACLLRGQGMDAPAIVEELERAKGRVRLLAIVDTLKYLHKGGRLPAAASIAGELLKVKPVIALRDGRLGLAGKGVGAKGSMAALMKLVGEELACDPRLPVYYGYTADDTLCRGLLGLAQQTFGPHRHEVHSVGAVIGTHVGPGAAVMVYLERESWTGGSTAAAHS